MADAAGSRRGEAPPPPGAAAAAGVTGRRGRGRARMTAAHDPDGAAPGRRAGDGRQRTLGRALPVRRWAGGGGAGACRATCRAACRAACHGHALLRWQAGWSAKRARLAGRVAIQAWQLAARWRSSVGSPARGAVRARRYEYGHDCARRAAKLARAALARPTAQRLAEAQADGAPLQRASGAGASVDLPQAGLASLSVPEASRSAGALHGGLAGAPGSRA